MVNYLLQLGYSSKVGEFSMVGPLLLFYVVSVVVKLWGVSVLFSNKGTWYGEFNIKLVLILGSIVVVVLFNGNIEGLGVVDEDSRVEIVGDSTKFEFNKVGPCIIIFDVGSWLS